MSFQQRTRSRVGVMVLNQRVRVGMAANQGFKFAFVSRRTTDVMFHGVVSSIDVLEMFHGYRLTQSAARI